jgi:predicted nucleic acid-binding protein
MIYAREEHHVEAARIFNRCRKSGIATTAPDSLIAATALVENGNLFSADRDFLHISKVVAFPFERVEV